MHKKFLDYIKNLQEEEKMYFDNGIAIAFDHGHSSVETQWNFGLFYPNISDEVKIYKWHRILPTEMIAPITVTLSNNNEDGEVALELDNLISLGDFVPVPTW